MSKYIAKLNGDRTDVSARNLYELQTRLCEELQVSSTLLTYHLLRGAVLNNTKMRAHELLTHLGILEIQRVYKRQTAI